MKEDRQSVLIVDDEAINFNILAKVLKDKYRILVAKNGQQALKILDKDSVDLILLDIVMPEMDGYEVLRILKNNDATMHIPVIFTTSKSEDEDEAKGLRLGAVDYIRKPFYLPIVEARVQTHVQLKLKSDILTEMVSLDGLTNIPNRRKLDEILDREWRRAMRTQQPLTALLIDVDEFKSFNDTYGHAAGDTCLRRTATALKGCLRRPGDFLARYGGEEFTILLPNTDLEGGAFVAETILQRVEDLAIAHERSKTASHMTVSVGGATAMPSQGCDSSRGLLEKADQMLYAAKNTGRNTSRLHAFSLA